MWRRDVPKRAEQEVSLAELVQSIADQLKPWKANCPKRQVLAEIHGTIEGLREATNISVGSRSENKQYAKMILATLEALVKQLAAAPKGFHLSLLLRSSQLGLWRPPKQTTGELLFELLKARPGVEQTSGLFNKLLPQVFMLSQQCQAISLNPIGSDPRSDPRQYWAAYAALSLMKQLSTKKPTTSRDGDTPFCIIASQLFEAVTGEQRNLLRACRSMRRALERILP
jgi:hypothetical protein